MGRLGEGAVMPARRLRVLVVSSSVIVACGGSPARSTVCAQQAVTPIGSIEVTTPIPEDATAPERALAPLEDPIVVLPIPDREQDARSPPSGWCGETAIQEGLLHLGGWASQAAIHRAGKPVHPDLYSNEIPIALAALGVQYSFYVPKKNEKKEKKGYAAYAQWVRDAIDQGDPVLAGVKLVPTEHPSWGLDHFVLVVGYGKRGLLVNTTWGRKEWVSDVATNGLSFENAFYGLRLRGSSPPKGARAARLSVIDETPSRVQLRVECAGLTPGTTLRLEQRRRAGEPQPTWSQVVLAEASRVERTIEVNTDQEARFDCIVQ